jgi:hypothetical protein
MNAAMRPLRPLAPLAASATALALAAGAHAAPCQLPNLHWMVGEWHDDAADTFTEERWAAGPGDRLMGSSWSLHSNRPSGVVEAETIQTNAAGVVVLVLRHFSADLALAWEPQTAPMTFKAAGCEPNTVVFDGQGDHYGEHITYKRAGDTLTFTGDFIRAGKPAQVVMVFTRER